MLARGGVDLIISPYALISCFDSDGLPRDFEPGSYDYL